MALLACLLLCLVVPTRADSLADGAVLRLLGRPPRHQANRLILRYPASPELDLVLAYQGGSFAAERERFWWDTGTRLGLFLQDKSRPGLIYELAIVPGPEPAGCLLSLQRVTPTEAVFLCSPEKGIDGAFHQFLYDSRAKTLAAHRQSPQFTFHEIHPTGSGAVLLGTNFRQFTAVQFSHSPNPVFLPLSEAQAQPWLRRASTGHSIVSNGEMVYFTPPKFTPVRFGPQQRFTLIEEGPERTRLILERTPKGVRRHKLQEPIGPWQLHEGLLWFGKSFYQDEGSGGVGGFGYFDPREPGFRIFSPAEIANWSASSLLVEPDAVWIGLVYNGEWGGSGGGLLRFDPQTQALRHWPLEEIIHAIRRSGPHLLLATSFGAALLDPELHLRRFFFPRFARRQALEAIR